MRIVPGKSIKFRYKSVTYAFVVGDVKHDQDGIVVDILVSNEFRHAFKLGENLSRWSPHRFQKFVISYLRDITHEGKHSV